MRLDGYGAATLVYESSRSLVYRARRLADGLDVIVKTPSLDTDASALAPRYHNERLIYGALADVSPIRLVELIDDGERLALILASPPGLRSLRSHVAEQPLSLRESLEVALGLVAALARIHALGIVHKDIKPDNVVVDASLSTVALIDFGIAVLVPRQARGAMETTRLEGTPAFMSPEQTGRLARSIDYRSDHYALGATLFWMIAGQTPFADVREVNDLVHAHITRVPPRLDERVGGVPPAVAKLVAKLLAKSAQERYQGSFGLRRDLECCLACDDTALATLDFEVGLVDPRERPQLEGQLLGRAAEVATLAAAHAASAAGSRVVVVRGASGMGKTELLAGFRESIDDGMLVVAAAKFEPFAQSEPLASFGQLLQRVIDRLELRLGRAARRLHADLRAALGDNAGLLVELVPGLAHLVPQRSEPVALGPGDARARFWDTAGRLVDVLLSAAGRCVLVLDDLQWADPSNARALELLLGGEHHVLVVLSARDDELPRAHALTQIIAEAERRGQLHAELELGPLTLADLRALLGEALPGTEASAAFVELLHRRTRGVPLYVVQLLHLMLDEGIVELDRERGRWRVCVERAGALASGGDIVDFLVAQLRELPEATRRVLGLAACIGARFEIELLAALTGEPAQVEAALWVAVEAGHLASLGNLGSRTYAFVHDRVQQAALTLVEGDRAVAHLDIVRRMLTAETRASAPELSYHIMQARDRVEAPAERRRCAEICAGAGVQAHALAAYDAAFDHFEAAVQLLPADPSTRARRFELLLALGQSAFLAERQDVGAEVFAEARELAANQLELTRLVHDYDSVLILQGQLDQALELCIEAAGIYELDLRRDGSPEWIGALIGQLFARLGSLDAEAVASLPLLDDPQLQLLTQLLNSAVASAYLVGDNNLYAALAVHTITIALDHGLCDTAGLSFVQLALMVALSQDYASASRYAKIAFAIFERFPASPMRGVCENTYASVVRHWLEPVRGFEDIFLAASAELRANGKLNWASYALNSISAMGFYATMSLAQVREAAQTAEAFFERYSNEDLAESAHIFVRCCRHLQEPELGTRVAWEVELDNDAGSFLAHSARAYTSWLLGDREAVDEAVDAGRPLLAYGVGMFATIVFEVVAQIHGCGDPAGRDTDACDDLLERLERWDQSCSENARPLLLLLRAACSRADGAIDRAIDELSDAADAARAAGFHSFEGWANEQAGELSLAGGRSRAALGYFEHALRAYRRWGTRVLTERVRGRLVELGFGPSPRRPLGTGTSTSTSTPVETLDRVSLIKLSQAMSEAIRLDDVIAALLASASASAGATRALLLLESERDGGLELRAELRAEQELSSLELPLADAAAGRLLARSLVRACELSAELEIVDDAQLDERVTWDPYVATERVRSLLVAPIQRLDQRLGVLYLENDLTPGAFAPAHVEVIMALTSQAAISIDHARLFETLRGREARWRALVGNAPDLIMVVDREHRVEFCNHRPEWSGEVLEAHFSPATRARVADALERVFTTREVATYEATTTGPEPRDHSARLGPIDGGAELEHLTVISSDVTERHALEDQLRHSQKMQAIGTLAGGVAHDFNNLLTIITGACELAALELDPDHEVQPLLGEVATASDRAAGLTRQLLTFSRRHVLQPQRLELNALVLEMSKLLGRVIGEDIELELELDPQPCHIDADPGQIEQVIMNLAVNARDAMPEGGALSIETRAVDNEIELEVADTGTGIASEVMAQIFDPFFTTKPKGEGTGLGLAMVHGIVEQSGGQIRVDSTIGNGTRFTIELPRASTDEPRAAEAGTRAELPRGHETILYVEDEPAVQRIVTQQLEPLGYRVLVASSANEALELAREHPSVDMLLTDVVLPELSGPRLRDEIVARHPDVRVLFVSGYTDDAVVRRGLMSGTTHLLQKPYSREMLATKIRAVLDAG